MTEAQKGSTEDSALIAFMSRHFVALTYNYESLNPDGSVFHQGETALSGFVIELHGVWFWVTAGHCLKDHLDQRIRKGQIRITGGGFVDYFGYEAEHRFTVPFTYERGCGLYVEKPSLGLDFALIPLDVNKRRLFEKNKVIAISRDNWIHQTSLTFERFKMLGIPADNVFTRDQPNGSSSILLQPVMVDVQELDPTKIDDPQSEYWFAGRLAPEVKIASLIGMSGGPIYGFRRDSEGHWTYHVVALQSRWRPDSRILFGCSLRVFAESVHQLMEGYRGELD